jgi:hypothetical protein
MKLQQEGLAERDDCVCFHCLECFGYRLSWPVVADVGDSHFRGRVWLPALTSAGLTDVHFHDLRHAGNHLVAEAGANLRELMERMGHSSSRAALIYLHSTNDRQRALADAVAERAQAELKTGSRGTSVTRPGETAAP